MDERRARAESRCARGLPLTLVDGQDAGPEDLFGKGCEDEAQSEPRGGASRELDAEIGEREVEHDQDDERWERAERVDEDDDQDVERAVAPRAHQGEREAEDAGRAALEQVGLVGKADAYPGELSGGQKQRVAIARALALEPQTLLMDEPTSSLDPELVGSVLKVIRELRASGMTMLIVSHEMAFAREAADRVLFMDAGEIVEQGDPEALFTEPREARTRAFLERFQS